MRREELFNDEDNNRSLEEINEMYHYIEDDTGFTKECIRHHLSALLADYDEETPLKVECPFGDEDACGLSSLQLPYIVAAFQEIPDGTIWFTLGGNSKESYEMDDPMFSLCDLLDIANAIEWEIKHK